jgi:hypothetical protein
MPQKLQKAPTPCKPLPNKDTSLLSSTSVSQEDLRAFEAFQKIGNRVNGSPRGREMLILQSLD